MHIYDKDKLSATPSPEIPPDWSLGGTADPHPSAQLPPRRRLSMGGVTAALPSLGALAEDSAEGEDMDITTTGNVTLGGVTAALPSLGDLADAEADEAPVAGDGVTAALPSLGDLATSDHHEEEDEEEDDMDLDISGVSTTPHLGPGQVTAALPSLGDLADVSETNQVVPPTDGITAALPTLGGLAGASPTHHQPRYASFGGASAVLSAIDGSALDPSGEAMDISETDAEAGVEEEGGGEMEVALGAGVSHVLSHVPALMSAPSSPAAWLSPALFKPSARRSSRKSIGNLSPLPVMATPPASDGRPSHISAVASTSKSGTYHSDPLATPSSLHQTPPTSRSTPNTNANTHTNVDATPSCGFAGQRSPSMSMDVGSAIAAARSAAKAALDAANAADHVERRREEEIDLTGDLVGDRETMAGDDDFTGRDPSLDADREPERSSPTVTATATGTAVTPASLFARGNCTAPLSAPRSAMSGVSAFSAYSGAGGPTVTDASGDLARWGGAFPETPADDTDVDGAQRAMGDVTYRQMYGDNTTVAPRGLLNRPTEMNAGASAMPPSHLDVDLNPSPVPPSPAGEAPASVSPAASGPAGTGRSSRRLTMSLLLDDEGEDPLAEARGAVTGVIPARGTTTHTTGPTSTALGLTPSLGLGLATNHITPSHHRVSTFAPVGSVPRSAPLNPHLPAMSPVVVLEQNVATARAVQQDMAGADLPPTVFPLTFQDFLDATEVQFLDHLRRGTSIGLGDLQPSAPPVTMQERLHLLQLTKPEAEAMSLAIQTLQDESKTARARVAEKDLDLSTRNPPIFQKIQSTKGASRDALVASVQQLKQVCRAQTTLAWKEYRQRMESGLHMALSASHEELRGRVTKMDAHLASLTRLQVRVHELSRAVRERVEADERAHAIGQEVRRRRVHLATVLAEARAQNQARSERLAHVQVEAQAQADRLTRLQAQGHDLAPQLERAQQEQQQQMEDLQRKSSTTTSTSASTVEGVPLPPTTTARLTQQQAALRNRYADLAVLTYLAQLELVGAQPTPHDAHTLDLAVGAREGARWGMTYYYEPHGGGVRITTRLLPAPTAPKARHAACPQPSWATLTRRPSEWTSFAAHVVGLTPTEVRVGSRTEAVMVLQKIQEDMAVAGAVVGDLAVTQHRCRRAALQVASVRVGEEKGMVVAGLLHEGTETSLTLRVSYDRSMVVKMSVSVQYTGKPEVVAVDKLEEAAQEGVCGVMGGMSGAVEALERYLE